MVLMEDHGVVVAEIGPVRKLPLIDMLRGFWATPEIENRDSAAYIIFNLSMSLSTHLDLFTPDPHGFQHQSMASFLPGLRRTVPRLSRQFFICPQCTKQAGQTVRQAAKANILQTIRFNSSAASFPKSAVKAEKSPLSALSEKILAPGKEKAKAKFFPETSSNRVAYWLLGSAASVFGIVVFGGLTRLTESG
jgi:hypothetical protein